MFKKFLDFPHKIVSLSKKIPELKKVMGGYFPLCFVVNIAEDKITDILTKDTYSLNIGESFTEAFFARKSFIRCNFDIEKYMSIDSLRSIFSSKMDSIGFDFEILITTLRQFRMTIIPFKDKKKILHAVFIIRALDKETSVDEIMETKSSEFRMLDRAALLESNFLTAGELDLNNWKVHFIIKPLENLKDNSDLSALIFEFAKHFGERTEFQKINEFFSYSNIHKRMQKTDEISEVFIRRNGNSPVKNYSRWTISKSHVDKNILIITETDITTEIEAEYHRQLANNYHQALLSDAIIVFNTSITKDLIEEDVNYTFDNRHKSLLHLINLSAPVTYTSFIEKAEQYVTEEYREDLHKDINIRALRKSFRYGTFEIIKEYEVFIENRTLWVNHIILMTKNPANDEITAVTIIKDITQAHIQEETHKRKLNEALIQAEAANKAKTDFLSNLSHDIRTPMNAIYGLTTVARDYTDDKEKMDDYIEKVTVASNHLLTLVNNVLDISRIESGNIQISQEVFKVQNLLTNVQAIVTPQTRNKKIDFKTNIQTKSQKVIGDELRINLILINILGNAVKFTPEYGTIDFSVEEKINDKISDFIFTVKDSGIGMSEEFITKIFMPFTRDEKQATKIEGSGLGMNITKNLVDLMGGEITVKSSLGKGTTFTVTLPLKTVESNTKEINYNSDGIPDFSGHHVLIAEDNSLNMEVVSRFIEKTGIEFDKAENGEQVLELFNSKPDNWYDLIFLDMEMPHKNGIDTVRELRNIDSDYAKNIPVIAMTGNIYEEDKNKALSAGMNDYITKPIRRELFYEKIGLNLGEKHVESVLVKHQSSQNDSVKTQTENKTSENSPFISKNYDFSGKRILIVDDNKMNLEIVKLMLKKTNAEFIEATNGLEAVEAYIDSEENSLDIILMDISMPIMNGYEAAKSIRSSTRTDNNIPIIAISANAFPEDIEQSEENGINYHISKPIVMKTLLDKISEYL